MLRLKVFKQFIMNAIVRVAKRQEEETEEEQKDWISAAHIYIDYLNFIHDI